MSLKWPLHTKWGGCQ